MLHGRLTAAGLLILVLAGAAVQSIMPECAAAQTAQSEPPVEIVLTTRHTTEINSVVLSYGDDRFVASSGDYGDHVIKLWDVGTGRLIRNVARIDPGNKYWRVTALSSDGKRLIVPVGSDTKVWDTVSGREILTIPDRANADGSDDNPVVRDGANGNAVIMSNDGARIAARRNDNNIIIYDGSTGRELTTLRGVAAVSFSQDGRQVAAGRADKTVDILDSTTGARIRGLTALDDVMTAAAYSDGDRRISVKSASGLIRLLDLTSNRQIAEKRGSKDAEAMFSRDGAYWAFADGNGTVDVLNVETGAVSASFKAPPKASLVGLSHDNALLLFTPRSGESTDWKLTTVRISTGQTVNVFKDENSGQFGTRYYIEGAKDGALLLRDIESWREVRVFAGQPSPTATAFSPNGARVALSVNGAVSVLDAETGQRAGGCPAASGAIGAIAFSPDGRRLAYGGEDKTVTICDPEKRTVTRSFTGHADSVVTAAFSADGRRVISGDGSGGVRIWEIATGQNSRTFTGPNQRGSNVVAFSPDGRRAFSGTDDNRIHIWNLATGREEKTLRMLIGPVLTMAISPDGRRVAAGSRYELLVKQWDIETGRELRKLETGVSGRFTEMNDVKYATAGDHVMAAVGNNQLIVWDIDSGQKKIDVGVRDQDFKSIAFSGEGRRLVTVDNAGVIRHWNRTTGALLVTVFPFGDGEWLRLTPEGFFDASPNAAANLSVVRGLDVTGIDQVYQSLYRPELVREKLSGDPDGRVKLAAGKLDLNQVIASGAAPRVAITAPQDGVRISGARVTAEARITDGGGGIGHVEWRVNGVTLGVKARGFAPAAAAGAGPANTQTVTQTLPLEVGDNIIEVVVYNARDLIASPAMRLKVTRAGEPAAAKPRLHVLAIGVNDYWDSRLKLNFSVADANAIAAAFEKVAKVAGGLYENAKVTTVTDAEVTRDHLSAVFAQVAAEVRPSDVFVLFIAGHGRTLDGRYYFIPYDFRYQDESSFAKSAISQDQWQQWISAIQVRKSILIYDTCESGTVAADREASRGLAAIEEQATAIEKLRHATGRTVLAASAETQPALEGYKGHGVLSYAVLEALEKGPVNKDGLIEVTGLIAFVDDEVPALSYEAFKRRQVPQAKFAGSNFAFGKPAPVLTAGDGSPGTSSIPASPTHVVVQAADVFAEAGGGAPAREKLAPGTLVTLVKTEQGWTLVARNGKPLGYVASTGLAPLQ
jgi:WD40 repeat protein